ncbi:MAG TPA: efflux RND transporter permease subunit [Planctomycetaceae bacterium]|nr:efflux RND transporter permease subunit [Planctomycetaceae bacterium]
MGGVLAWFARNRVAANLFMMMVLVSGTLAAVVGVRRELFPVVTLDTIAIRVPYPGATPVEVEEGIVLRIEEAIADLDGIETLDSMAAEGAGLVIVKARSGYDARRLMDDIKTRVDALTSLPRDAEEPVVEQLTARIHVITVAVSSETADEWALRALAEQIREELLNLPGISQVKMGGVRPYEIGIHVSERSLEEYALTFDDVARAVRASSLDVPAGAIRAGSGDILIRTRSQAYFGRQFEDLVLLTKPDGTRVLLKDVATVVDGFQEDEAWARFDGRPAVMLNVLATGHEDAPTAADRVRRYVEEKECVLPAGVHLDTWFDFSRYYDQREALMLRNGFTGLVLVFLCLALFLHLRLAFWVAMGLLFSFVGTFVVLWYADVSVNMISMAAFILVLGIVVDDAIVVSESVHHHQSRGEHGEAGAIAGVCRVAGPVTFAVLTSVIAFLPMFGISGVDGKFWRVIPAVIVSCLLFSLAESLFILPAHLSHEPSARTPWYLMPVWPLVWCLARAQRTVDAALQRFIQRAYLPALDVALRWRYTTVGLFLATLIVTIGLVAGGRVRSAFFPRLPGDVATATLEMPDGTSAAVTRRIVQRIEAAAMRLREELDGGGAEPKVVKHLLVVFGSHPMAEAQDALQEEVQPGGPHLAEVSLEFQNLDRRGLSSQDIADRWRELVGPVPGVRQLTFDATEGHGREDIHLRLAGRNLEHVAAAAEDLKAELRRFAGVYEIRDTLGSRRREITLRLKPAAETLGLRVAEVARQVRQAFYGEEAQRVQRGRHDVRVMVRYPPGQRRSIADLETMRIRTPTGSVVPLREVAEIHFGEGVATIRRSDRRRVVDVTANLQRDVVDNADRIMAELQPGFLATLAEKYPGMTWSREGGMKDQRELLRELAVGFAVALFAMYALMAIAFKSYVQPLLVGSAIPFGFVGAVAGHLFMGQTFSIVSFLGLVALAGVVVNDSLVLIDAINRMAREGMPVNEAVRVGARQRFRAILLTSLTTFLGLTPLMTETSVQARFIIPMAVALAFGVAFATVITLALVPSLYLMIEDGRAVLGWIRRVVSGKPPRPQPDHQAEAVEAAA